MHKKLYKAKKNWVIGLIAGTILLLGSVTGVNADVNTPQNTTNATDNSSVSNTASNNKNTSLNTTISNGSINNNQADIKGTSVQSVSQTNDLQQQNVNATNTKKAMDISNDENEYPNKATIVGNEAAYIISGIDGNEYSDVSPKNPAIPKQNTTAVSKDNVDPSLPHGVPLVLAHYNKQVGLHQMLFSKEIKRRGQLYTVGLATNSGNQTFITYFKDKDGEVIGAGSGIEDSNIYFGDGRYYGNSFLGHANVKWNNGNAVAFGRNSFNNGDALGQLPKGYQHAGDILNTQIKVYMQGNGVLNYEITWDRNTKEKLAYLKSRDKEQPFSFNLGKLIDKNHSSWFDSSKSSPIKKINNNLYRNYIILEENPHYIIQFIKVDYPTTQVTSVEDNDDMEVYSPLSDKRISDNDKLTVIAFDKDQTQHIIKFQRIFLSSRELSGLDSKEILTYVNDLFENTDNTSKVANSTRVGNGKQNNAEEKNRKGITVQFINNVTKKLVGKSFKVTTEVKGDQFNLNNGTVKQIEENIPNGFSVVLEKNLLPKHEYIGGRLYIYVQIKRLNPELIGTVDVTQQNKEFLQDKGEDLGEDFAIDKAGELIDEKSGAVLVDPLHYIDLANKVSDEGFGEEEAEDLFSDLTGTITSYLDAAEINPKLVANFGVRDVLNQVGTTGKDFIDIIKDGISSLNEKGKYYHEYRYNRDKKNENERKRNFLDVRKKQMNSIFEGASTIKDGITTYFQSEMDELGTFGKVIISGITAIVMFVIAWITKFIWNALQGKEMSKVFGLKVKDSKLKKK
ncbi:KxYKxGKxW signal peptide domain-containing protein [Limosilactobacillus reuteri]|uniref:KxYKxGKxW signal peptide domain-containing protein n=1 Tax=Limosilactobacillus reuteri TaxID=1598 RepID=UPI001E52DC7A|nr:KxYKxGKxW signal peptide domain-containing protein [Limosilactobacillus reuteri]MCC4326810.1 KxYKxGKxW signal peptide domain-containing protein [Limosilactobacillus reuteri]MCC4335061.1 KxYKxGKxW signal peptide domain-containing protein [Limosilactobacillus reuteri]MCC4338593.1 KxYKxGKxW signal peptide domain-containing protein [Limosilactobacillus reuteri]